MAQAEQNEMAQQSQVEGSTVASAPLVVGEVLFDCFSDHERVLGGAPFNVAWNLQGFGLQPIFLSAIGNDDDGRHVRTAMQQWGMNCSGLQTSTQFPTGRVQVVIDAGQPNFEILPNQAYDEIRPPEFDVTTENFSLLYLGSLAFRSKTSRRTITNLISVGLPRFVDINIRQPWFDPAWLEILIGGAQWIKLNEIELALISGHDCETEEQIATSIDALRKKFEFEVCYVTRGSKGVCCDDGDAFLSLPAPPPTAIKDTVGAGDAFSSATILGLCQSRPIGETLRFAAGFASKTCELQGATTTDSNHYAKFLQALPSRAKVT